MNLTRAVRIVVTLIVLLASTISVGACTTQERVYKVGIINTSPSFEPIIQGLKDGLGKLGYEEGKNIIYLYQGPYSGNGVPTEIRRLMGENVDIIIALSTPAVIEAKKLADGNFPIIFAPIYKPVNSGLVSSLRQPGEQITGIHIEGYIAKELEWLINLAPRTRRVFAPYNPADISSKLALEDLNTAAKFFGVEIISPEVTNVPEISGIIQQMPPDIDAIFMIPDSTILAGAAQLLNAATERKIPIAAITKQQVESGALFAFGPDFYESGTQCARLVDQVFKGIDAGTLPVERTEYYLTVNRNTASAIGFTTSEKILRAADTIIR